MIGTYLELARAHAPLLMVVIPFVGAALMIVGAPARASWFLASALTIVASVVAADLAMSLLGAPQPVANVGVDLFVDGLSVFAGALVSVIGALAVLAAGASLRDADAPRAPLGLALLLCVIGGWIGALMARDLISMSAAVTIAWLAAVGLVTVSAVRERSSLNGALRMLSVGGVAIALLFAGAGLLGTAASAFDVDALLLAHISMPGVAAAGAGMMMLALALMAGVAPLHNWLSVSVARANPITALAIGVCGVVGALSVFVRLAAYAITAPEIGSGFSYAAAALGAVSVVVGSVQAVGAANLGRLAAYAGASQAGCLLLSVGLGSPAGFAAALIQLAAIGAGALALYAGAGAGRVQSLAMLDGYAQRAPLASAAITAGALSCMGAPLTLGFLGRWRLVESGVGAGWWWAAGLVIIASLAGVFYGGRLVERMYFRRAASPFAGEGGVWRIAAAPALIAAMVAIAVGLAPGALLHAAANAASLLTGAPS